MAALHKSFSIATRALARRKLQTTLTMVGMTIGVATVLTMIALGSAAESSIQDQVRAAGMNVILVKAGNYRQQQQWTDEGGGEEPTAYEPARSQAHLLWLGGPQALRPRMLRVQTGGFLPGPMGDTNNPNQQMAQQGDNLAGHGAATTLSLADAAAAAKVRGVQYVSAGIADYARVEFGESGWFTRLHGESPSIVGIRRTWVLRSGRFFRQKDVDAAADVVVLGSYVSQQLFGAADPVGQTVTVRHHALRVIGVIGSGSWIAQAQQGDDQFDAIYVPVTTAQAIYQRHYLDALTVSTENTGDVTRVTKALTALLRERHGIAFEEPSDFTVTTEARKSIAKGGMRTDVARAVVGNMATLDKVTLDQLAKTLNRASRTMTALLGSIAAVSLIVGGIGIMNIMLLSVTERTREIGIRRAVGARSDEIMLQFLMEAIVLSAGGGLLGVGVGMLAARTMSQTLHWGSAISPLAVGISFGISAIIGIAFGYYPARKASLVSPMTSLRYE
jgi:ABC-type antimicrobial peptide transport system permease subunit